MQSARFAQSNTSLSTPTHAYLVTGYETKARYRITNELLITSKCQRIRRDTKELATRINDVRDFRCYKLLANNRSLICLDMLADWSLKLAYHQNSKIAKRVHLPEETDNG